MNNLKNCQNISLKGATIRYPGEGARKNFEINKFFLKDGETNILASRECEKNIFASLRCEINNLSSPETPSYPLDI